jgi:hypothetical protein
VDPGCQLRQKGRGKTKKNKKKTKRKTGAGLRCCVLAGLASDAALRACVRAWMWDGRGVAGMSRSRCYFFFSIFLKKSQFRSETTHINFVPKEN